MQLNRNFFYFLKQIFRIIFNHIKNIYHTIYKTLNYLVRLFYCKPSLPFNIKEAKNTNTIFSQLPNNYESLPSILSYQDCIFLEWDHTGKLRL